MLRFIPSAIRFGGILILTGVMAGLVGALCQWILHTIEHFAWGKGGLADHTLIEGAMFTTPQYRFVMVMLAGILAAASWGLLVATGTFPRISQAMSGGRMPLVRTVWHALTQIVIVALGASAGREAAPREITSAMGARIGDLCGLDTADRRIIVGCAAGAGLAAVYAIPASGVFFTLEVMLLSRKPRAIVAALVVNLTAVLVASGGDISRAFYKVPPLSSGNSVVLWALLAGPVVGVCAFLFRRGVRWAESRRPETLRVVWTLPLTFVGVGALAAVTPTILGNGQASAQTFFFADHYMLPGGLSDLGSVDPRPFGWLSVDVSQHFHAGATVGMWSAVLMVAFLTVAKAVATLATIRSGAWGGTLTPALAVGAGVAAILGLLWEMFWPGAAFASYVFIGAAAFLGVSLNAPLTGAALVFEFTRADGGVVLLPLILAVLTAQVAAILCEAFAESLSETRTPPTARLG